MQTHSHFFSAYGILKLIFKKKGEHGFVGRFHDKFPISARNPITNAVSYVFNQFHFRGSLTKSSSTLLETEISRTWVQLHLRLKQLYKTNLVTNLTLKLLLLLLSKNRRKRI
jgi:hypothetical protein